MKISIIEILVNLFSCALGSAIELLLVSLKEFLLYDGSIGRTSSDLVMVSSFLESSFSVVKGSTSTMVDLLFVLLTLEEDIRMGIDVEVLTLFLMDASPFTVDKLKKSRAPIGKIVANKAFNVK